MFKTSIDYILNKCDILDYEDCIMFLSVKFLYGLRTKKEPKAIVNMFKKQNQRTKNIELYPLKAQNLKIPAYTEGLKFVINYLIKIRQADYKIFQRT